ncbi:MAG: DNA-directed RNA polymerase subunit alpha C-terminal domain-containing protein [Anaerolineaceae bacterium]
MTFSLEEVPISVLELSVRHYNPLIRAGYITVGRLRRAFKNDSIRDTRSLGERSIAEIQEKLENYLADISFSEDLPGSDQAGVQLSLDTLNEPAFDMDLIADLPLSLVSAYLGKEQTGKLVEAGIKSIGQLHDLLTKHHDFIHPRGHVTLRMVNLIKSRLGRQVREGSLSADLLVGGQSLGEFLKRTPAEAQEAEDYLSKLKPLVIFENLDQELDFVFGSLTARQEQYYLRYQRENTTLEVLGQEEGITRERVRQILNDSRKKIESNLSQIRMDYLNTALAIGERLDGYLSREKWQSELERYRLIDKQNANKTVKRLGAILLDKNLSLGKEIPENVSLALKAERDVPAYIIRALKNIPAKQFREIDRRVRFTGGIDKDSALEVLKCKPEELDGILTHHGLEKAAGWFTIRETQETKSRLPLLEAGLRMWHYCGPLELDVFQDGLQRYVSRRFDTLAPTAVMKFYMGKMGFVAREGKVYYEGTRTAKVSGSEDLALEIIDRLGPVVSFLELVDGFLTRGYSAASATSKVMSVSAVVERIENGYYKKRGVKVSQADLKAAKARQESADRDPAIAISEDGKVRYQTTVNTWALGGVLSVSKLSKYIPDLSEGCPVYVSVKNCGRITGTENLIWGLTAAFNELGVRHGDYIELEFDKKRRSVQVKMLQRREIEPNQGSSPYLAL